VVIQLGRKDFLGMQIQCWLFCFGDDQHSTAHAWHLFPHTSRYTARSAAPFRSQGDEDMDWPRIQTSCCSALITCSEYCTLLLPSSGSEQSQQLCRSLRARPPLLTIPLPF
jgi:hypothetical protein